jgi:hypothetical protein
MEPSADISGSQHGRGDRKAVGKQHELFQCTLILDGGTTSRAGVASHQARDRPIYPEIEAELVCTY